MDKGQMRPETDRSELRRRAEERVNLRTGVIPESPGMEEARLLLHELRVHEIELEMQNEELRRAQAELEESRTKYADLYDFAPVGYFMLNKSALIVEVNLTGAAQLGVERSQLRMKPFSSFVAPECQDELYRVRRKMLNLGGLQSCEIRMLRKDGTAFYAQLESVPFHDATGETLFRTSVIDVTARRNAGEALRAREELLRTFIAHTPMAVAMLDHEMKFLAVSDRWLSDYRVAWEEIAGRSYYAVFPESPDSWKDIHQRALSWSAHQCKEEQVTRGDGTKTWVNWSAHPWRDANGQVGGIILFIQDITERKRDQAELIVARNLESLGVLAGGLAHDFNNLLYVVFGNIELVRNRLHPDSDLYQMLSDSLDATHRARDLTAQLITFSRGGSPGKLLCTISSLAGEAVRSAVMGSNIAVEYHVADDEFPVAVDPGQITRVFYNLALNARQATTQGGKLVVRVENEAVQAGSRIPVSPGEYVKVSFEDDGEGISPDKLDRIFDPYFTTRGRGSERGTGLGLAICHSIVQKHDGCITVRSEVGKGSTFSIYLPCAVGPSKAGAEETRNAIVERVMEPLRVLYLEDEEQVSSVANEMLESLGCRADVFRDGTEVVRAYKTAREEGNPYDLVLLDLFVPGGQGGLETFEKLLAYDPEVKAAVVSGFITDPVFENYRTHGLKAILAKPFTMKELSNVIAETAGRDPGA